MAPPLTPVRSPMPSRSHRQTSNGGRPTTVKKRRSVSAIAASSSEKETPTVVFTETSPFPHNESGGGNTHATNVSSGGSAIDRSTLEVERLVSATAAMARPRPKKLFRLSQNSSPGSEAGQSMPDENASPLDKDNDSDDFSSRGKGDSGNGEFSSDQSDEVKNLQVVSMIQNVLDGGIASVCRLRKLFPASFFLKMDVQGTTITQFHKESIKRIATMEADEDESYFSEDEDDEASMVKSFDAKTQKTLSPLTEMTQKRHRSGSVRSRIAYDENERRMAMEALLLLRWMQQDGVGKTLKEGNLASVHFGICVPSDESPKSGDGTNNDELLESYSFNISCDKPKNPSEVKTSELHNEVGLFFQNLNGFQAGRSLSQSVVPSKTQSSFHTQAAFAYSQASRGTSHYDTQTSSVDFSSSRNYYQSESQPFEISQKSLMKSLSQSIRASVKKNHGSKIPPNRYLTLRIDFTKMMEQNELPLALKPKEQCSPYPSLLSPFPITSGAVGEVQDDGTKGNFVVTPLGRIAENGYSGICVDMTAKTREKCQEDEKSIQFPQLDHSFMPRSQEEEESFLPFTQAPDEEASRNESNTEAINSPEEAVPPSYEHDDDNGKEIEDHPPFTQPPEREQVTKNKSYVEAEDSLQNTDINCDELFTANALTQNARDEAGDKENEEIQVGSKAFALPYGLKCDKKYVLCDVRDHRFTRSCLDGMEREEYKCAFKDCKELEAVGKKKQWIMRSKMIAYSCMERNVQASLFARDYNLKERKERRDLRIFSVVGDELQVDPGFVKKIACKRKAAPRKKKNKRLKKVNA